VGIKGHTRRNYSVAWRPIVFAGVLLGCFATSGFAAIVSVFNTNDAFAGSLRQAIQDAPANSKIVFQISKTDPGYNSSTGGYLISLTSGSLVFNKSLIIDGGTQRITIQRSFAGGTPNFQLFKIYGGTVTLANLTLTHGSADGTLESGGSAIYTNAFLTLKNCAIYNNSGGGLGALENVNGFLTISGCTIANNSSFQVGAIDSDSSLAIDSSTFIGNKSTNPSTGAIYNSNSAPAQIRNTIVVGNFGNNGATASDVTGAFVSSGYNIIGTTNGSTGFGATGDQLGVTVSAAKLGPLQDNGGPTFTMRPLPGSVAIDQGLRGTDLNSQPYTTDARGYPTPVDLATPNAFGGNGSDIGAVELGPFQAGPTFVVTNTADRNTLDDGCTNDDCTLAEAITAANANADTNTITFAIGIGPLIPNAFLPNGLAITAPVNIVGPGARQLAISGGNTWRIFNISGQNVTISGLTFRSGKALPADGGAIYNGGSVTLTDCAVQNSSALNSGSAGGNGGGLFNALGATAVLNGCTFSGNSATFFGGGAVCNNGHVTATNCTFTGNTAPAGGAFLSISNNGTSLTTLRNCTITGNTATETSASTSGGGGYYGEGGPGNTLHHFSNTILAGNTNSRNPDLRGFGTSEGNNIVGNPGENGSGFSNGVNGDKVGVSAGTNALANNGGLTDTCSLLGNSVAINMGNDALALSTDQRGFGRSGVSDIGAFESNGVAPPVSLVGALSRKTHGDNTNFDINLALTGTPTVEPRDGGAGGNHTLIFTFTNPLSSVGSAAVTNGVGNVSSSGIGFDSHQFIVNVTAATNAQRITVSLTNVTDSLGHTSPNVGATMGLLLGDTTGNGTVNATDISQAKSQSGQPVSISNFRNDITVNGSINATDVSSVKLKSGTGLP
jgi:dockerin type I repeat protein